MGSYSEVFFRSDLRADVPEQVINTLMYMVGDIDEETALSAHPFPDHEFFQKSRWKMIGSGSSEYYPVTINTLQQDQTNGTWSIMFLSHHKDYSGETAAFFDWISPYCSELEGRYLGYELFEDGEDQTPKLFFQTTPWRPTDQDQRQFWKDSVKPGVTF